MPTAYKHLDPETMREIRRYVRERNRAENEPDPFGESLLELINSISSKPPLLDKEAAASYRGETRSILEHIRTGTASERETAAVRRAILYLNKHPEHSGDKKRLYALTMRYLAPKPMTVKEIAVSLNVDKATAYRYIDAAIDRLSALLYTSAGNP